jgi:hypothetical protein
MSDGSSGETGSEHRGARARETGAIMKGSIAEVLDDRLFRPFRMGPTLGRWSARHRQRLKIGFEECLPEGHVVDRCV